MPHRGLSRPKTGDLTTVRMSDVIGRARWHEQAIYRDYFKPVDIENVVDLGLGAGRDWYRSVVLLRERDNSTIPSAIAPSWRRSDRQAREARAALREVVVGAPLALARRSDDLHEHLDTRARRSSSSWPRRTGAEIANELWVSSATVKHLENVYAKLGVGSRAAAASRIQAASSAG